MNRAERRALGVSKETSDKLKELNSNCTVLEAIQLAQGVADDTIVNYHNKVDPIIVSLSLQIELLKQKLFSSGLIDEAEYVSEFQNMVEEYQDQRDRYIKAFEDNMSHNDGIVKTDMDASSMEVNVVRDSEV